MSYDEKDVHMTYLKLVSRHFAGATEKRHE
jgi:hypothetical protein